MRCSVVITRPSPCVAAVLLLCALPQARAQTFDNPDVFALASQVAEEIEFIREVMGRPFDDSPRLPASGVSQLEVFFQAQTLFRKVNQLAQDYAGAPRQGAPAVPEGDLRPADTYAVIRQALEQVELVKDALGIETQVAPHRRGTASATGAFMTIVDANRQLNLLLDEPIRPSDVFQQVTLAVLYSAGILANYGITEVPEPFGFEGYKRPSDVYSRLLECLDLVSDIAANTGVEVLRLSSRRNIPGDIEPGHVYDIARILVADLAVLSNALDAPDVFPTLEEPARIFPTQVFERAGILLQQLQLLDEAL